MDRKYYKATIVCEGGAMAGIYTAGVLDVLMENNIYTTHIIGVSCGSCNSVDYVTGQIGRTIDCMAIKDKEQVYAGFKNFLKTGKFYDYDKLFNLFPTKYVPFDFDTYNSTPMLSEIVITNCLTGEPMYVKGDGGGYDVMNACRASSSMPFFTPPFMYKGIPTLDGGTSKSIPIDRALSYGNEKNIVILTKPAGYAKKPYSKKVEKGIRIFYRKYPKLADALINRHLDYNNDLKKVESLEKEGKVFVLRPEHKLVERHETNYEKLRAGYLWSKKDTEEKLNKIISYLEN